MWFCGCGARRAVCIWHSIWISYLALKDTLYYNIFYFLDTIYFTRGKKHPKIIIDGFEYKLHRRGQSSSFWACTQHGKYKCKVRAVTTGHIVKIKDIMHSHSRTHCDMGSISDLPMQKVSIIYSDKLSGWLNIHL